MHDLVLPEQGWGELRVARAEPYAGKEWTDSGKNRDERHLKERARGEVRTVPCPPELTAPLNEHVATFGLASDGRLFQGERNAAEVPRLTINRAWRRPRGRLYHGGRRLTAGHHAVRPAPRRRLNLAQRGSALDDRRRVGWALGRAAPTGSWVLG